MRKGQKIHNYLFAIHRDKTAKDRTVMMLADLFTMSDEEFDEILNDDSTQK